MTVPKEIIEKVKEIEAISERWDQLDADLRRFFGPHMEGCCDLGFFYSENAEGDPQEEGEFCEQSGNPDWGYSGNCYFPAEGGGYAGVSYHIF